MSYQVSHHEETDATRSLLVSGVNRIGQSFDFFVPSQGIRLSPVAKTDSIVSFSGVNVNPEYLKSVILNQENKTKIRPILLAFNGLPKSGKTKSVSHLLRNYVDSNPITPMTDKNDEQRKENISYYELVAAGFHPLRELTITEVTKESSCAFGILSAFRKELLAKGEAPLFNGNPEGPVQVFDDSDLDGHLQYTFRYLHKNNPKGSDLSKEEEEFAQGMIKLLPEGIALINVWDVSINARVLHCLSGFFGHLYNCHSWLFLDIERDLKNLDCIPEVDFNDIKKNESVLMTTRPRLHYLLRSSRMSQSNKYNRKDVCTIFARHTTSLNVNSLKHMVTELENKIKQATKHVGVSFIIEPKIETVVLDDSGISNDISHHLYQKFQQLIYQTPYEDVPLSWVFLRSLFYRSPKIFISKSELKKKAKECGMDDDSFGKFCEFYTSFGSIFDLSLVDQKYLYVIVKPMGFLRSLDKILHPDKSIRHKYSAINCGIVSEKACMEVFQEIWSRFMEALEAICLATKVTSACIDISDLSQSEIYYYVPLTCTDLIITSVNPKALYLMTSLNMPHIFQPAIFAKHLLELLPNAKLIPCAAPNKTLIKDYSTSTTITIVSHSPTTMIQVDQVDPAVCSQIIQACHKIANACNVGPTKYKFIVICAKSRNVTNAKCIPSSQYHVLPNNVLCDVCAQNDRITETLKAWNKAVTEFPVPEEFMPNEEITISEFSIIAKKLGSFSSDDTFIQKFARVLGIEDAAQFKGSSGEKTVMQILLAWDKSAHSNQSQSKLEHRQELARKLLEFGAKLCSSDETVSDKSLQPHAPYKMSVFENLARELDAYAVLESETEDEPESDCDMPQSLQP